MSAYDFETILKKWERDELSTEQAIGQILLVLENLMQRVGRLEIAQANSRRKGKTSGSD